jgi:hypothetical protein
VYAGAVGSTSNGRHYDFQSSQRKILMKKLVVLILMLISSFVLAQTGGDKEAVSMLEEAVRYSELAKSSAGSQKSDYMRKAATSANLACNFADSPSLKSQACSIADRYSRLVE